MAAGNKTTDLNVNKIHYVTFQLGTEFYGLPIQSIKEVIQIGEISPVPKSPPYHAGVMKMRKSILSLIDLRILFGIQSSVENLDELDEDEYRLAQRAIVSTFNGHVTGLLVDKVLQVIQFTEPIEPAPASLHGLAGRNIIGLGKKDDQYFILLNIESLLTANELAATIQSTNSVLV